MGNSTVKAKAAENEEKLCLSASRGDVQEVRRLIESGVDIRCPSAGNDPLKLAIENCRMTVVKILCSCGSDVNKLYEVRMRGKPKYETTPLCIAMKQNNYELVRYLCLRGADVNNRTGWYVATEQEMERNIPQLYSYKVLEALLEFGLQVDVEDLMRHMFYTESFNLLLDYSNLSILKQIDLTECTDLARDEIANAIQNRNRQCKIRPKAKNFPMVITRGYISMRTHKSKEFKPVFLVLTVEHVLLCFSSPVDIVPKFAVFVEDFVNIREGTITEGCAREEYVFVLQSLRKDVPHYYFACWSAEVRDIWVQPISVHFDNGLNITGGDNNFLNLTTEKFGQGDEVVVKQDQLSAISEVDTCKICFENQVDTVILPCGHCCCCEECLLGMQDCPICRRPVERLIKIFKA